MSPQGWMDSINSAVGKGLRTIVIALSLEQAHPDEDMSSFLEDCLKKYWVIQSGLLDS